MSGRTYVKVVDNESHFVFPALAIEVSVVTYSPGQEGPPGEAAERTPGAVSAGNHLLPDCRLS